MYARAELGPLQESLKASMALSDQQIALLQGPALAFPLLIFAVPLGLFIDRYSRKRILMLATAIDILATIASGVTREFSVLFASRCAIGACAPMTTIAAYSLVSDMYRSDTRGRATTVIVLGAVAGTAAAFVIGGQLLSRSGEWGLVMLWTACILVPALVATLFLRDIPRREQVVETPSLRSVRELFARHWAVVAVLVAGMALVGLADGAALVWTAPTLSRTFALSPARVGTLTGAAIFASGTLGPLLGGPLADLCQRSGGPRRAVLLVAVLASLSVPAGLFGALHDIYLSVSLLVLFLILGNAISVIVIALTISVLPNELRGVSMTIEWGTGAAFGFGVAPLAVAELSVKLGGAPYIGQALAIVCAIASLLGMVIFVFARGMFRGGLENDLGASHLG